MPSPGRVYTISLNEAQVVELEEFLQSADDGENIIKVLREQVATQRPDTIKRQRRDAVKAIRAVADGYEARARSISRGDPRMRKSLRDDASDLTFIADFLECEEDQTAREAMIRLDTAVREDIPRCAWPFLGIRPLHG